MTTTETNNDLNFGQLLDEYLGDDGNIVGAVLTGLIVKVEKGHVTVDVGLKSEGVIPIEEFELDKQAGKEVVVGGEVDVFVKQYEDRNGIIILSRDEAVKEEEWVTLQKAYVDEQPVNGKIFSRIKGGYTVDLGATVAFLPNSQLDIRPIRDITPLLNIEQPFMILKMDQKRGNIIVSRRMILEESQEETRKEVMEQMAEGKVFKGVVKNITDYGVFVDLGGIDGLLHVTDVSWKRITHPSEVLKVGQEVNVIVTKYNQETGRISLGMKQLQEDPWASKIRDYQVGMRIRGEISNICEYGAFIELEDGIEGLVHVSEMSWTKKNIDPGKIVAVSENVDVQVLEIEEDKRRISLGMKQCTPNPWAEFAEKHPVGSIIKAPISSLSESGLVITLQEGSELDGFIPGENLHWTKKPSEVLDGYHKDLEVEAKVIKIDSDNEERVILSVKHLESNPFADAFGDDAREGKVVTCVVTNVKENGIEVQVGEIAGIFIRRSDLSRERSEQRPDRFAAGEKVDAMITQINVADQRVTLSIKAHELAEEKRVLSEYGSTDSGASLGDILGISAEDILKK